MTASLRTEFQFIMKHRKEFFSVNPNTHKVFTEFSSSKDWNFSSL